MMKKLLTTIALLAVLNIPFSCNDDEYSCPDEEYINTITDLVVALGTAAPFFNVADSVPSDSAVFQVRIRNLEEEVRVAAAFDGFMAPAMALSCIYRSTLKHQLDQINITSSEAVMADGVVYEPGASLNEIFVGNMEYNSSDYQSVEETVDLINNNSEGFSSYDTALQFRFEGQIEQELYQTFSFEFVFSDRTIVTDSPLVYITTP